MSAATDVVGESGGVKTGLGALSLEGSGQFSTFYVADRLYGIDVMQVQEVTKALSMTPVPLAPKYVHGLINLRGQLATAVGLRDLFEIVDEGNEDREQMNIVCRMDDLLISVLVDQIGDVMIVGNSNFESAPNTIPDSIRRFMKGVYKISGNLISIIDIEKIIEVIKVKNV